MQRTVPMNKKVKSTIFLMLTAIIWGTAFVAQREGMSSIGPFMFSALRMYLGTLTLIPIIYITLYRAKLNKNYIPRSAVEKKAGNKLLMQGGLWCGLINFFCRKFSAGWIGFNKCRENRFYYNPLHFI